MSATQLYGNLTIIILSLFMKRTKGLKDLLTHVITEILYTLFVGIWTLIRKTPMTRTNQKGIQSLQLQEKTVCQKEGS